MELQDNGHITAAVLIKIHLTDKGDQSLTRVLISKILLLIFSLAQNLFFFLICEIFFSSWLMRFFETNSPFFSIFNIFRNTLEGGVSIRYYLNIKKGLTMPIGQSKAMLQCNWHCPVAKIVTNAMRWFLFSEVFLEVFLGQAIWGHIWKRTVDKSQTSATNVTMHPIRQAIWGHIWKRPVEKSHTNATSVTMHPLGQAIWGHIWKRTVEKSQTIATSVTMHPLVQTIWGHIWRRTVEKSQTNATNATMHLPVKTFWGHI